MASRYMGTLAALGFAAVATQACATRGYVREQLSAAGVTTKSDIAAARDSAVRAADASRAAGDQSLNQRVDSVAAQLNAQVAALRNDLQGMRADFGAQISAVKDSLKFNLPVNFAFNDASVRSQDAPVLARFAAIVKTYYPDSRITVEGFADPAGPAEYNKALSKRRAESVRAELVNQGVNAANLATIGYGESRLVSPGATRNQTGAELNRRVVFAIETAGSQVSAAMLNDTKSDAGVAIKP